MNIVSLHTFIAIVENGSLVRASKQMNVTQSTVTARLKTLETELGQVLLNRQKSGISLTPAGTKLLHYARVMTGLWRQARQETALSAGLESSCTFGCHRELWHGPGRALLNHVLTAHSRIAMTVHQGCSRELEDWLAQGAVEVVLTYEPMSRSSQTIFTLPPEVLILYAERPDRSTNCDPQYIFVDHGEEFCQAHGHSYYDAGVARISFDSSLWALQYLLEHGGSAYLPEQLAKPYVAEGKLYPLANAPRYQRKKHLVAKDAAVASWTWFAPLLKTLGCLETPAR